MRILMRRMRDGKNTTIGELTESLPKKELSMRNLLKITRKLNEDFENTTQEPKVRVNKKNVFDQTREEDKFNAFFSNDSVNIKFIELEIYDDLVFWGGTIDGTIQFIYRVTPDEATSGVEFNYLPEFNPENPENQVIIDKVKSYYDSFYKYWRDNALSGE